MNSTRASLAPGYLQFNNEILDLLENYCQMIVFVTLFIFFLTTKIVLNIATSE